MMHVNHNNRIFRGDFLKLSDKEKKQKVYLKVEALTPEEYTFSYAFGRSKSWTVLGKVKSSLLSTATAGGFTGTTIGVYATGE